MNKDKKKTLSKVIWSLLFIVIAAATVAAVITQTKEFSLQSFWEYIKSANPFWMILAFACSFGFIFFEALAVNAACGAFGYKRKLGQGIAYSSADIYFSAITPSATGGQPASAYFMMKDGIPGTVTTAALLANLVMYTLSILILGIIGLVLLPFLPVHFNSFSMILIAIGAISQTLLAFFFILLIRNEKLLLKIGTTVLKFLGKIRIIKNVDDRLMKFKATMANYGAELCKIRSHKKMLGEVFIFNFLQRFSTIAITAVVYMSTMQTSGSLKDVLYLIVIQIFVVLGSNSIPIPGAMGVADYLMLDGFRSIMSPKSAANLEILSRSLSFYICIIFCGITAAVNYFIRRKRNNHAGVL